MRGNYRTSYAYDAASRVTTIQNARGFEALTAYNTAGLVASTTDPLTNVTAHSYDAVGRLIDVQDALGFRTTTAYDDAGRMLAEVDSLNRRTTYSYDTAGRRETSKDMLGYVTTTATTRLDGKPGLRTLWVMFSPQRMTS